MLLFIVAEGFNMSPLYCKESLFDRRKVLSVLKSPVSFIIGCELLKSREEFSHKSAVLIVKLGSAHPKHSRDREDLHINQFLQPDLVDPVANHSKHLIGTCFLWDIRNDRCADPMKHKSRDSPCFTDVPLGKKRHAV